MNQVYVAFVRGLNVGGSAVVTMEKLAGVFTSLGLKNVRTVLASGNVVFESAATEPELLAKRIEQKLRHDLAVEGAVAVRTGEALLALLALAPFKTTKVTPTTKLHVTFLPCQPEPRLKISHRLATQDFQVRRVTAGEVCSAVDVAPKHGTTELMKVLEKEFGPKITTRTWNTLERIGKLLALCT